MLLLRDAKTVDLNFQQVVDPHAVNAVGFGQVGFRRGVHDGSVHNEVHFIRPDSDL